MRTLTDFRALFRVWREAHQRLVTVAVVAVALSGVLILNHAWTQHLKALARDQAAVTTLGDQTRILSSCLTKLPSNAQLKVTVIIPKAIATTTTFARVPIFSSPAPTTHHHKH